MLMIPRRSPIKMAEGSRVMDRGSLLIVRDVRQPEDGIMKIFICLLVIAAFL
jgi:hypothetical protein